MGLSRATKWLGPLLRCARHAGTRDLLSRANLAIDPIQLTGESVFDAYLMQVPCKRCSVALRLALDTKPVSRQHPGLPGRAAVDRWIEQANRDGA
jgi:hypothetical protein